MTKPLTFEQAAASTQDRGYELLKYAGSSNAYGSVFRCSCGHTWSAKHNNVVSSNKTGCPECAKKAGRLGDTEIRKSLQAEGAELVSIESELKGQGTVVRTRCQHGHERVSKLGTIIYAKKPCPECSKQQRGVDLASFNERLSTKGYRIVTWVGSTRAKGTFQCKCGETWEARVNSVLQGQSNCPACYEGGLRGDEPAVFYIYELSRGRKLRHGYGISGAFDRRDIEHRRSAKEAGWKIRLTHIFDFKRGADAVKIEKQIKSRFFVPKAMFHGFKTEAVMPKDLQNLVATLTNSGVHSRQIA